MRRALCVLFYRPADVTRLSVMSFRDRNGQAQAPLHSARTMRIVVAYSRAARGAPPGLKGLYDMVRYCETATCRRAMVPLPCRPSRAVPWHCAQNPPATACCGARVPPAPRRARACACLR